MSTKTLERIEKQISRLSNQVSFTVSLTAVNASGQETGTFTVDGERTTPGDVQFYFPEKILETLLVPGKRFYLLRGGRSAGKSHSIARFCIALAIVKGYSVLCLREIQKSIEMSVHRLIGQIIEKNLILSEFFQVGQNTIKGRNGSIFAFAGAQGLTVQNLKSYEDFPICWIEEGQTLSRFSWDIIGPTIRAEGAKFFINLNPVNALDALYLLSETPDPRLEMKHVTFQDNYFTPSSMQEDAKIQKERDEALYNHKYLGGLLVRTDKNVFKNWTTEDNLNLQEIVENCFQYQIKGLNRHREEERINRIGAKIRQSITIGLDYGHVNPSAGVLVFHDRKALKLYILREFYQSGLSVQELSKRLKRTFPEMKTGGDYTGYFDNASPGIIATLRKDGLRILPCKKIEILERIASLQGYEIIIDSSCTNFINEISGYQWQETNQGIILDMVDKSCPDHLLDAMFYAVGDTIIESSNDYERISITWG